MEPGRLIAVTGTRTDLPAGATVQSGEIAMVASVSTDGGGGDTAYSTLNLAASSPTAISEPRADLRQRRRRPPGRDDQPGARQRPAGAGAAELHAVQRAVAGRSGSGPARGRQSTLTVTVDGIGYAQVDRFDSTTPAQSFLLGTNASGQTTITFPAPQFPPAPATSCASYRTGDGSQGNLQAGSDHAAP